MNLVQVSHLIKLTILTLKELKWIIYIKQWLKIFWVKILMSHSLGRILVIKTFFNTMGPSSVYTLFEYYFLTVFISDNLYHYIFWKLIYSLMFYCLYCYVVLYSSRSAIWFRNISRLGTSFYWLSFLPKGYFSSFSLYV